MKTLKKADIKRRKIRNEKWRKKELDLLKDQWDFSDSKTKSRRKVRVLTRARKVI